MIKKVEGHHVQKLLGDSINQGIRDLKHQCDPLTLASRDFERGTYLHGLFRRQST